MHESRSDVFTKARNIDSPVARREWVQAATRRFQAELTRLKSNTDLLVITSEHFHSRLRSVDEVKRVYDLLAPFSDDIEIVVYLRRQDRLAVSLFSTKCRGDFSQFEILPDPKSVDEHYYNYRLLIDRWSSVFGADKIVVRNYDAVTRGDSRLLLDFIDVAGLPNEIEYEFPPKQNQGLSGRAQAGLLYLNSAVSTVTAYDVALKRHVSEMLRDMYPGEEMLPSRADAEAFYDLYRASNSSLARTYLSSEILFDEDFSRYPEEGCDVEKLDEVRSEVLKIVVEHSRDMFKIPIRNNRIDTYYLFRTLPYTVRKQLKRMFFR